MTLPHVFYGAYGNEGCADRRPLSDDDNQPIPGTDHEEPIVRPAQAPTGGWVLQPGVGDLISKKEEQ